MKVSDAVIAGIKEAKGTYNPETDDKLTQAVLDKIIPLMRYKGSMDLDGVLTRLLEHREREQGPVIAITATLTDLTVATARVAYIMKNVFGIDAKADLIRMVDKCWEEFDERTKLRGFK